MLYIHKQSDIDYFTPMFHKNKCSMFVLESSDANSVYIKETKYNVFLYLNETKKWDSNSFYVGATTEINKATKFKYKDILWNTFFNLIHIKNKVLNYIKSE